MSESLRAFSESTDRSGKPYLSMPAITCRVQPGSHKRKQKTPQSGPLSLPGCLVSCLLAIPCWLLWVDPSEVILTLFLLFCSLDMLPNTSGSLLHVIFFYNLLSPALCAAYVCTLMLVLQHICRGLKTTLESLFSPPTRDPTNKTQVVQLPWQGLLSMEASFHPRRCSVFILSLASIVLKIEIKLL